MSNNKDNSKKSERQINDEAWKKLFEELDILEELNKNSYYEVTAETLKKIGNREPRLLAKIESRDSIPEIFQDNKLCILPNKSRGHYTIGYFDAFTEISYDNIKIKTMPILKNYQTLDPNRLHKEPQLILSAYNFGILQDISDNEQLMMTNFGRESSPDFNYSIRNLKNENNPYNIEVNKSQMEMDGIFESDNIVLNIEAKMNQRSTFLSRQLYYPFRLLREQTDKKINNIFMTYSTDGTIYTHVYEITKIDNYNSFKLISSAGFRLFENFTTQDLKSILDKIRPESDAQNCIFPQADSISKVVESLKIIHDEPGITDSDLAYKLSISSRQGGYYSNACEYLGLVLRSKSIPVRSFITEIGENIINLDLKIRNFEMIKLILKHEAFHHFTKEFLETREINTCEISEWLKNNIFKLKNSENTSDRRASTVKHWICWIYSLIE